MVCSSYVMPSKVAFISAGSHKKILTREDDRRSPLMSENSLGSDEGEES